MMRTEDSAPKTGRSTGPVGISEPPPSSGQRAPVSSKRSAAQLSRVSLLATTDVDEARATFSRIYTESRMEPRAGVPFACALEAIVFGPIQRVLGRWPGGTWLSASSVEGRYLINMADVGTSRGAQGSDHFSTAAGQRAALFSPGRSAWLEIEPGFRGQSLTIEHGLLESHFRTLTGRDFLAPIAFDPALSFEGGAGPALHAILSLFHREIERPEASLLWLLGLRDALITSLLTNTRHTASALLEAPPPRVAQGCVRRAEEFMAAHAGEPITLADIVAAAGVPARSLRAAFQAARGMSPMEVLRQRRFDVARQRLAEAAPGATVVSVVTALGLGHPGRFSIEYRKRFGESPSETLAVGRAAAGLPPLRPRVAVQKR